MLPSPLDLSIAFAAGAVSFASPCVLPVLPGYLATLGVAAGQEGAAPPGAGAPGALPGRALLRPAALFVLGFGIVFTLLGLGAGFLGGTLVHARRPVEVTGGVAMIVFGLLLVAEPWLPLALQRTVRPGGEAATTAVARAGRTLRPLLLGVVFAAAWSPCIGPTLGSILTRAATERGALPGGVLLATYSAGLGLPFLAVASVGGLLGRTRALARHTRTLQVVCGLVLAALGALVALGVVSRLSQLLAGHGFAGI